MNNHIEINYHKVPLSALMIEQYELINHNLQNVLSIKKNEASKNSKYNEFNILNEYDDIEFLPYNFKEGFNYLNIGLDKSYFYQSLLDLNINFKNINNFMSKVNEIKLFKSNSEQKVYNKLKKIYIDKRLNNILKFEILLTLAIYANFFENNQNNKFYEYFSNNLDVIYLNSTVIKKIFNENCKLIVFETEYFNNLNLEYKNEINSSSLEAQMAFHLENVKKRNRYQNRYHIFSNTFFNNRALYGEIPVSTDYEEIIKIKEKTIKFILSIFYANRKILNNEETISDEKRKIEIIKYKDEIIDKLIISKIFDEEEKMLFLKKLHNITVNNSNMDESFEYILKINKFLNIE